MKFNLVFCWNFFVQPRVGKLNYTILNYTWSIILYISWWNDFNQFILVKILPYCLFPGCIVTWAWSLAKGQYMVSWLLTGAPEQRYWQNRETANVGLDSSVGRAPARQSGGRRFKSRSSKFFFVHPNLSKICTQSVSLVVYYMAIYIGIYWYWFYYLKILFIWCFGILSQYIFGA